MANETKIEILEAMCRLRETRPFSRLGVVDIAREATKLGRLAPDS